MFLLRRGWLLNKPRFPRASGDVPEKACPCSNTEQVFPARAGMFRCGSCTALPRTCFPRASGDVPWGTLPYIRGLEFSPRERGCSLRTITISGQSQVFPARAGMFPLRVALCAPTSSFPRASGDVPGTLLQSQDNRMFSPRERGCSHHALEFLRCVKVFPAWTGMFRFNHEGDIIPTETLRRVNA